jgi:hypothetical protein
MLVQVRELGQPVELAPAELLLVGIGDLDAVADRFLVDAEGLDGPERGAGLVSIERRSDPGGSCLDVLSKN